MSEIITVTGTVEEIIYSNPDNGYSVVGIDSVEEGQFTATGYMPFITEGESVALSGNWTTHPDYGEQFKAEYYETVMPSDEESIIKYLSSGIISGIREATAKKLIDHFGLDVLAYPAVKTCRNQRNKQRKSEENRRTICRNTVYAKYRYVPSTVRNFRNNRSKSTQFSRRKFG